MRTLKLRTIRKACVNADLIQLAGMESIEAAGGPCIPFTPGEETHCRACWYEPTQQTT